MTGSVFVSHKVILPAFDRMRILFPLREIGVSRLRQSRHRERYRRFLSIRSRRCLTQSALRRASDGVLKT